MPKAGLVGRSNGHAQPRRTAKRGTSGAVWRRLQQLLYRYGPASCRFPNTTGNGNHDQGDGGTDDEVEAKHDLLFRVPGLYGVEQVEVICRQSCTQAKPHTDERRQEQPHGPAVGTHLLVGHVHIHAFC
jgi:hypothetical protein